MMFSVVGQKAAIIASWTINIIICLRCRVKIKYALVLKLELLTKL